MTKLAPEWVRTSDPLIRSPVRYRWTTAPALHVKWRKWPEISERHEENRPAFTERFVF